MGHKCLEGRKALVTGGDSGIGQAAAIAVEFAANVADVICVDICGFDSQAYDALGRQAATRSLLRDLYSPDQLQEQLTWFWFNHFNVHLYKRDIRVIVGDSSKFLSDSG